MDKKICNQIDCDEIATHSYIWPGQGEKFSCESHARWAQRIMGHTFASGILIHKIPVEKEEEEKIVAKIGMRIHVYSPDQKEDWGVGTIITVTSSITVPSSKNEGGGLVLNYPSEIKLDSGDTTEGCACWWYPEDKHQEILRQVRQSNKAEDN